MSKERTALEALGAAADGGSRIAAAVASSSLAAALVDVNSARVVLASEAAARLLRAPAGNLVGRSLSEFAPEGSPEGSPLTGDDQTEAVRDALTLLQTGAIESYQAPRTFRRLDGTTFQGRVWVRLAEDSGRRCFIVVFTDERAGGPFAASLGFIGPPPELALVPGLDLLTGRENEVLERLMSGARVPQIAEQMFLAPPTVRNHLSSIYRKLGVHSQADLVALLRPVPGESNGGATQR